MHKPAISTVNPESENGAFVLYVFDKPPYCFFPAPRLLLGGGLLCQHGERMAPAYVRV